jgi:hypothetical protein
LLSIIIFKNAEALSSGFLKEQSHFVAVSCSNLESLTAEGVSGNTPQTKAALL